MKTLPNDIFFAEVERMIAEERQVVLRVRGNSMRPFIRSDRTRVQLSPCQPQSLKKGDIVLFRFRGRHILHRIIRRDGERFLLAGDGNYRKTETCTVNDIVAVVVAVIRPDGRTVECTSLRWRAASKIWVSFPPLLRRIILGVMWRSGLR